MSNPHPAGVYASDCMLQRSMKVPPGSVLPGAEQDVNEGVLAGVQLRFVTEGLSQIEMVPALVPPKF
jgi:hypothetical protein